ncbi:unnamed protein product [Allacma fusca]|uniref:Uncharacterized protein n=1 Tax=Allacma fusca TaxID=39272 RepID=A0A8J2P6F6_9HEXA|nr:unnamed protein product [Allacma fusca]
MGEWCFFNRCGWGCIFWGFRVNCKKKLDVVHVRTLNWWASNAPPYVDPRAGRAHRRFKQEPEEAPNPGIHLAVNNSTDPQDECDDQEEASHQVPEAPEDV